jgi:putative endonuclease
LTTSQKGKRGEAIAATALTKAGYVILDRNWRCSTGEIDLIARHRNDIVFIEVRTRADGTGAALESITPHKAEKLTALAYLYLAEHELEESAFRIDIAAVSFSAGRASVEIVENAIGW